MSIGDKVQEYLDTMRLMGKQVPFDITIKKNDVIATQSSKYLENYSEDINIPDFITEIGNAAFSELREVKRVIINSSVRRIGSYAFYNCMSLSQIDIPDSVISIGDSAFHMCRLLKQIRLPKRLDRVGNSVFRECTHLEQVNIPDSVVSIEDEAFSFCSQLTQVKIPKSVQSIGTGAFFDCGSLTTININDSVLRIGTTVFYDCKALNQLIFPLALRDSVEGLSIPISCEVFLRGKAENGRSILHRYNEFNV